MLTKNRVLYIVIATLLLLTFLSGSMAYMMYKKATTMPKIEFRTEYVKVPEIKEVVKVKRVEVPVEKIVVLEKEKVVEKLKDTLPEDIKTDDNKQITATAEIPPYRGITEVISMFNIPTGETEILARQKPLPIFEFGGDKEIGLKGGLSSETGGFAAFHGRMDLFMIKEFHFALYGELNIRPEAQILGDAYVRF